jgi:hypothetical protein
MVPTEEMFSACLNVCKPLNKAYKRIIRRNVEAELRGRFQVEDPELVDQVIEETIRRLKNL